MEASSRTGGSRCVRGGNPGAADHRLGNLWCQNRGMLRRRRFYRGVECISRAASSVGGEPYKLLGRAYQHCPIRMAPADSTV